MAAVSELPANDISATALVTKANKGGARRVMLASHGRLQWYHPDTDTASVLHEGGGVHYGTFPGSTDASGALSTVWVMLRPHNWHPVESEETLLQLDAETGSEVSRSSIPSRFTHDVVRSGSSVFLCNTEEGKVLQLAYPGMEVVTTMPLFTRRHHVNTLAPLVRGQMWAVLNNLGDSLIVRIDMPGDGKEPYVSTRITKIGVKAHGLVAWKGGFLVLDSDSAALVWVTAETVAAAEAAARDGNGPDSGGVKATVDVLWTSAEPHKFLKGLCVVDGVAYFGVSVFQPRDKRASAEADSELAAFDLLAGKLLWKRVVPTHGLLNVVSAPHLGEDSTYRPASSSAHGGGAQAHRESLAVGAGGAGDGAGGVRLEAHAQELAQTHAHGQTNTQNAEAGQAAGGAGGARGAAGGADGAADGADGADGAAGAAGGAGAKVQGDAHSHVSIRAAHDAQLTKAQALVGEGAGTDTPKAAGDGTGGDAGDAAAEEGDDVGNGSADQAGDVELAHEGILADKARFAADRGQMITIVSAYSPTEAASDEEAGDFYLRVAALADKANDKRDLLIVAGGSQRRAWDSSQLRRPAVRREFNLQLSDRFGLLEAVPPEGADAQAEYDAMAAAIREVATNHLAPRGSRRRRGWQFTLSQRTLRLMDARQRAHSAWLRSKSAAAKRERNRANRAADAAVQRDRERWISQQVAEAQDMLRKKNLRQFARACDRLAGRSRSHQIPPAMRDVSGALHSGPDGVLKAMTESFDKLYGGETKLSDETLNQLENDVAAFELTRATEVDEAHGRPPDLAETEACVRALRSAAAPGGDQLDAMLLRCPPAIAWLNRVIIAEVEAASAMLESEGFTPLIGGRWDSGLPYLTLDVKRSKQSFDAGIMLPLRMIDIGPLQALVNATPESWWEADTAIKENVQLGGRKANVDRFKPGVKAIIMQFSDQDLGHTFVYPWHAHFKAATDVLLDAILGPGNRNKVVRMQLANMQVGSTIKMHRDMGGYATDAHRIHIPVITHDKVSFESCPGLEKRAGGRSGDKDATQPGDCVRLPMHAGMAFELNNRVLHRVLNEGDSRRVQLVVDVGEVARQPRRIRAGAQCDYKKGKIVCADAGDITDATV
ncbi:hypothetical protein FOA52_015551 [Chlamydomonas sp. UWO 241]|nr:hypothetical protein FOA52_015551 [Chlamydomonas sp. UWO 241]